MQNMFLIVPLTNVIYVMVEVDLNVKAWIQSSTN